jgi:hypothetical protein
MAGWAARRLNDVPLVTDTEADDPAWHPLQHFFGLRAFGANAFVAREAGQALLEAHDERGSGQEELYLVVAGAAEFELDGQRVDAPAVTVVAVTEPSVRRSAVAREAGTTLIAIGQVPRGEFASTWHAEHFEGVPRAL